MQRNSHIKQISLNLPAIVVLLAGMAITEVSAQEGHFYIGIGLTADSQDARYHKSVIVGKEFAREDGPTSDSSGADETIYGLGALFGYRWPLFGSKNFYLSGEIDIAHHSGTLRGNLDGTGLGFPETWPEAWSLEKDYSYGLTLKLGRVSPGDSSLSLYTLAGIRSIRTDFKIKETAGCEPHISPCPPYPSTIFNLKYKRDFTAWVLGAGVEKQIGESMSLQLEARYTDYSRKRWSRRFTDPYVNIPSALDGDETGLAMRLVRYF